MPISKENKSRYPKDWKQIRAKILQECNNKCEFCEVDNYSIGYRNESGDFVKCSGMEQEAAFIDGYKLIQIILTIAHLDHIPENCSRENLKALCQKCHLNYDKEHHRQTRIKNKNKNQLKLIV